MASIVRHGDGWRAHVYVKGTRESRLFRTRREADAWAARREEELGSGITSITFAEAAERWLAWKLPRLDNAINQRTMEQSIRDHALPDLGHKKLTEIKRKDLIEVVKTLAEAGKVETAHRVGQRIRAIFDHAIDHGDIEAHPAAGLSRVLPQNEHRHMRSVRPDEMPTLLRDVSGYPEPVTRAGLLLMAHTFVRTSELIGARWAEFHDDIWVIPGERMKLGKPHVVPLSTHVRALLEKLRPMTDECPFVLPARTVTTTCISNNTLLFALYRLGYRGRMTGHGFRALASTILNESGKWSKDAIERQLAHKETDEVREAYHRAQYLDERRRMMQWYSEHLMATQRREVFR
jgi:integrase